MEHPAGAPAARAEDLLRALSVAMHAVRLYPQASPMRAEAILRFTAASREVMRGSGPLQYRVDRNRFIIGDAAVGEGVAQIASLAEMLHALQVRQLIVAPEVTEEEIVRFLEILNGDAAAIRASGGFRKALLESGIANVAVVEVTLRASTESGLLGLDLTTSPLDEIAPELAQAAEAWAVEAGSGEGGTDEVADAISRLEPAARDLAMTRCAEALRFLDEESRLSLLNAALTHEPGGPAMDGMLDVVAHMPPAALARLLRMTAQMRGEDADELAGAFELPPEVAEEVAALMRPAPVSDEARGIPAEADVSGIVAEVTGTDEHDMLELDRLVAGTTSRDAAARGLGTALRIARLRVSEDALRAIGDAIPGAAAAGALHEIADAAAFLGEAVEDPALTVAAQAARGTIADPALARECVRQLLLDPQSSHARPLLQAAGGVGAEALIEAYTQSDQAARARLIPTIEALSESVAPIAGRMVRTGEPATALGAIRMLEAMASRRLVPTVALGLEHLDARVREAAVIAIARTSGSESLQLLEKCLAHWDPETRRIAAREIGVAKLDEAVPALLKVISVAEVNERNYELKKEVLKSLDSIGSDRALPVLKRLASRRLVIGKKNRELRYLAAKVLDSIEGRGRSDTRRDIE
ncbi:MAG: HEAT repeat domain-containing protein [Coriobacteriia bacterium]|nr:HEAT repeat domain-containing protein [Coriobacteriia bacterium]